MEFLREFTRNFRIPKPCVIPRLDPWISSQRILKFPTEILSSSPRMT
ncbi:MAG: hypothetical protein MR878_02095 [Campylobacter sp.]|nr:hypothetical protein [Campylobacter sp.]